MNMRIPNEKTILAGVLVLFLLVLAFSAGYVALAQSGPDYEGAWACMDGCYNMLEVTTYGNVGANHRVAFDACADVCLDRFGVAGDI